MPTVVMNTVTRAVTEYDDSSTASAVFGAVAFLATSAYLRKVDTAVEVTSHLETHPRLWGDQYIRRPRYAYVACRNPGAVTVSIELANGDTFDYPAVESAKDILRVDLGRGLRSNYFGVRLTNVGTSDFRLDGVDIMGKQLRRKV